MVIENFEDILCYNYHYPVEEYSMVQFRKRKNKKLTYFEVLQELTTTHILVGIRKYGEFEVEWYTLKRLLQEQIENYNHTQYFPTANFHILLDQALLLEHEGNPIPNLLR
mgnify:CR=1 FL=1